MTTEPRYSWRVLRAGEFRLDGGSMFGVVPRVVWSRNVPSDERGRITVQHNCLLLRRVDATPGAAGLSGTPTAAAPTAAGATRPPPRTVVIETGTGDKLDDKSRDLFAMERRSIIDALRDAGTAPESVDAVVVSHLHFDHAGGLTRVCREGETPDWTGPAGGMAGSRPDHGVKRTFPSARVYVQRREWLDALANRSVMTRTYFRDHLEPLEGQLTLVDSPAPFTPGVTPDREAAPLGSVRLRRTEIEPGAGVWVFQTPGHTWGQQAVMFIDDQGRTVVFTPDVLPTAAHLGAAFSLAYDVEPYTSMLTKRWFLEEAAAGGWLLVLDHEAGNPVRRVKPDGKGWFTLEPLDASSNGVTGS
jgi:glyoxylase-like metal-dependent hydrolase (beta-lactamase superfamily II)